MPKNIIKRGEKGSKDLISQVVIENTGNYVIEWECGNFSGDKNDVVFTLIPHEPESFDREYAKAIFGDWTIDRSTREGQQTWANNLSECIRRFPGGFSAISVVVLKESDGSMIWDGPKEYHEFISKHANDIGMLPRPTADPRIQFAMPKVLKDADQKQLSVLWQSAFNCKMPLGMTNDNARGCLIPMLTADQIYDVLAEEKEPTK